MSRRDSVLRRPDRPAAPLVLLLTLTLLQGAAAGRLEERDVILIGYTEQKRRAAAEAAVKQQLGGVAGGVASGTVGVALDPLCPPDDRPDHCPGWARIGECLRNPVFMRKSCKASCKVLPSCFASIASGPWGGHATPAGTARFALGADEAAAGHFREHAVRYTGVHASNASLTLSSLGIGTYLGAGDDATDEAVTTAILKSIASGWNVIDTAANYRGGRAETAVGRALHALRLLGDAERDQLFISTKAGYSPDGLMERLLQEGEVLPTDVVNDVHSMHPSYLLASLDRSLAEMGVTTVDLLYLHNPAESQLAQVGQQAFMQRLRAGFEFCEQARAVGKMRAYGIASWSCFRVPPGHRQHLSLQSVVELAEEVGGKDHGFRYIQLPVSAGMPEAWSKPWQELVQDGVRTRVTLMKAAEKLGLGVFGSGPLMEAELLRKPDVTQAVDGMPQLQHIQDTAPRLLQLARSTPGLLTSLVGHKTPKNVDQNCNLAQVRPLDETEFRAALADMKRKH